MRAEDFLTSKPDAESFLIGNQNAEESLGIEPGPMHSALDEFGRLGPDTTPAPDVSFGEAMQPVKRGLQSASAFLEGIIMPPIEATESLISGLISFPPSRAAKIVALAKGKSEEEAEKVEADVAKRITWVPKTPSGQKAAQVLGTIVSIPAEIGRELAMMPAESWGLEGASKEIALTAGELATYAKTGHLSKQGINYLKSRKIKIPEEVERTAVEKPVEPPQPPERPPVASVPEKPIPSIKEVEKVAPESISDSVEAKQSTIAEPPVEAKLSLLEEAKKYKTAEEFVEGQGVTVYHGGEKLFKATDEIRFGNDVFYTLKRTDKELQEIKAELTKDSYYSYDDLAKMPAKAFGGEVSEFKVNFKNPFVVDAKGQGWMELTDGSLSDWTNRIVQQASKSGKKHDGIIIKNIQEGFSGKGTLGASAGLVDDYIVLDKSAIVTKAQLTDIWNEAHKGKVAKEAVSANVEKASPTFIENEQKAISVGDNPTELKKRLLEAKSNLKDRSAFKNSTIDIENKRLVSDDGTIALQWKVRPKPELPESYENQQTTKGTVVIEKIKEAKPPAKEVKIPPKPVEKISAKKSEPKKEPVNQWTDIDKLIAKAPAISDLFVVEKLGSKWVVRDKRTTAVKESLKTKVEAESKAKELYAKENEVSQVTIVSPRGAEYKLFNTKENLEGFKRRVNREFRGKDITFFSGVDPTLITKVMKDISTSTAQIIENAKPKPEIRRGVKVAKEAMIEHDRNIRAAEFTSKQLEKVVKDIVPKEDRQMEMVHAYEQKMRGKHWNGLTEIEKGIVRWAAGEKAKLNKYIKDNDVLEMMESKNINHIFHHWINPESGKPYTAVYGKFSKGLPQAKQRTIPTYESGIKAGLTPATTNIGKLIGLEWEAATRANSARQLFKILYGIKGDTEMSIVLTQGKPPRPIRMVERWDQLQKQGLSDSYIRYDSPFLDKTITFRTSDGSIIRMKGAVGVQKDVYPFVQAYIESPSYGNLSKLNFATKSLKLGISMFHVVSLGMQELANLRIPFVHIPKGLKLGKELGPTIKLLHQEGLELFKGYEDLGYQNTFFEGVTVAGKAGNVVAWPITKMRDFIFGVVQPGMKTSFADMQFRKMLPKYLEKAGEKMTAEEVMSRYEQGKSIPDSARVCARDVVKKSDGHFSGEHYKRSLLEANRFMVKLYFSPEARKFWQAALLSPTWQREHLLVAKNVAKSFMPDKMIKKLGMEDIGPIKSQYRRYALGGIMIIGAVDLWNQMSTQIMDGESKHIWENPKGKGFAVRAWWDEPDYKITTKDGKTRTVKGGPAYIRPLKSLFEVAEWFHDPIRKASYKLSPIVSAIGQQLFGMKNYGGIEDIPDRAWDLITDVSTPIVVDQTILALEGRKAPQGVVTSFFGVPASKGKKQTSKSGITLRRR